MAFFNGKNNMNSSAELLFERAKYKNYMNNNQAPAIVDFSLGEYTQYGRISPSMNVIYNNALSLKPLQSSRQGQSFFAVDFVADAFHGIKAKIQEAMAKGTLAKNIPYISDLDPMVAYISPVVLYQNYIERMFTNYNDIFLNDYKINSFGDYYKFFLEYAKKMGHNYPMTFSGFQKSKHSSIFTSGLAISITDYGIDDDSLKEEFIINSPAFSFFKDVCLNNGMVLMENAPWIMVADILSPSLLLYTKEYYLSTKNSIFLKYFNFCMEEDIELLFNYILIYFRKYYNKNAYYNSFYLCEKGTVKIKKVYLEPININNVKNRYTDSYIYDMYVNLKNIEENYYFTDFKIKEIIKKAKFFEKTVDNSAAISYIRKEFRNIQKFRHGGLNYLNERALKRRNNDISNT